MKKIFKKVLALLSLLWHNVDKLVDKIAPIAIKIVEEIKKVNESATGDVVELIISRVIPGTTDDAILKAIREKLKEILPKTLLALNISVEISNLSDPEQQIRAIIKAINLSSDQAQNAFYHSLSAMIMDALADGKLTWSESVHIVEHYYTNFHKKN